MSENTLPGAETETPAVPLGLINDAAMVAHEANRAFCLSIGDSSQSDWRTAPGWQRDSAVAGALAIWRDPATTPEQSHEGWTAQKVADGWVYGPVKDAEAKTHPCLVPYDELPVEQQRKDALFGGVVRAVLGLAPSDPGYSLLYREYERLRAELAQAKAGLEKLQAELEITAPGPESTAPTLAEGAE